MTQLPNNTHKTQVVARCITYTCDVHERQLLWHRSEGRPMKVFTSSDFRLSTAEAE